MFEQKRLGYESLDHMPKQPAGRGCTDFYQCTRRHNLQVPCVQQACRGFRLTGSFFVSFCISVLKQDVGLQSLPFLGVFQPP